MKRLLLLFVLFIPVVCRGDQIVIAPLKYITATPTVDTSAYAAGDVINSTVMTFAGACKWGQTVVIQDVVISDLAKNGANIDAVFFSSAISSYGAINAAFDPADADLAAYLAASPVLVDTHTAFNDNGVSAAKNVARVAKCSSAGNLYLVLVARAAITYAAATDVKVSIGLLQ